MEYLENEPNIFKYAPKELSQDAFLCWLVAWLKVPNNEEYKMLQDCARDFISENFSNLKSEDIETVEILQQYKHIDILFLINGKYCLIIEDKVNSNLGHANDENDSRKIVYKNQIDKYVNILQKEGIRIGGAHIPIEKNRIQVVFYKTGLLNSSDVDFNLAGIIPILWNHKDSIYFQGGQYRSRDIFSFFNKFNQIKHPIFRQYFDLIRKRENAIVEARKESKLATIYKVFKQNNPKNYDLLFLEFISNKLMLKFKEFSPYVSSYQGGNDRWLMFPEMGTGLLKHLHLLLCWKMQDSEVEENPEFTVQLKISGSKFKKDSKIKVSKYIEKINIIQKYFQNETGKKWEIVNHVYSVDKNYKKWPNEILKQTFNWADKTIEDFENFTEDMMQVYIAYKNKQNEIDKIFSDI